MSYFSKNGLIFVQYLDGIYLREVDRVLRPGGYWVLSGPPINWKTYYKTWKRTKEDLKAEQTRIEDLAESLCWEKKYEKGDIAIWRKKINAKSCKRKSANYCKASYADDLWLVNHSINFLLPHLMFVLFSLVPTNSFVMPIKIHLLHH